MKLFRPHTKAATCVVFVIKCFLFIYSGGLLPLLADIRTANAAESILADNAFPGTTGNGPIEWFQAAFYFFISVAAVIFFFRVILTESRLAAMPDSPQASREAKSAWWRGFIGVLLVSGVGWMMFLTIYGKEFEPKLPTLRRLSPGADFLGARAGSGCLISTRCNCGDIDCTAEQICLRAGSCVARIPTSTRPVVTPPGKIACGTAGYCDSATQVCILDIAEGRDRCAPK